MEKYIYTKDMGEISGLGGGYEQSCRDMAIAGAKWLEENDGADIKHKQFENIYGLSELEGEKAGELEAAICAACDDTTGAMFQASTNHAFAIHRLGWDEYAKQMIARDK